MPRCLDGGAVIVVAVVFTLKNLLISVLMDVFLPYKSQGYK